MLQRKVRDYQVSLWSLQDSFLATLKHYGLEFKGQIQQPKLTDKDDGTQEFSFSIPMYLIRDGKRVENPAWYTVQDGNLLVSMRKIKVIFNKDASKDKRKIYQFLITKVTERHEGGQLFCDVESEGLAFHELGKIGYKISLSADDFYNDDYDWYTTGKWTDSLGNEHEQQPLATLNYWNDRVFSTVSNWTYDIEMDWKSYSLYSLSVEDQPFDDDPMNDFKKEIYVRDSHKVYEDDYVESWQYDEEKKTTVPSKTASAREKTRVSLNIQESNIYNITQTLAETFGVFCKYEYQYDDNFHICGRKVIYYNNFFNENYGAIDLTYPYDTASITREIDSTDLVTKLFVRPVDNSASAAGQTNIMDVGANRTKEDYILNFDYLHTIGGITDEQYALVQTYSNEMRRLNDEITPLSAKLISLQSQLTKLEAQKTTYTNSIIQDTEQLGQANDLLNSVTQGTGLLSLTKEKPQTAVLMKDDTKPYESYYIKITQKGVYAETIQIFKTYNYKTCQLDNEIKTGNVEYDEFGNVIRVNNIFIGANDPKTVYVIYDYEPSLYYERIQAIWETRLAEDEANLIKTNQQLAELNYRLYGTEPEQDTLKEYVERRVVPEDRNIQKQFQDLINQKNTQIKRFNSTMGAALREGYWQPDDYTDYGDRYTDTLQIGNDEYVGSTSMAKFEWDSQLFEGEQDFKYEYTAAQSQIAYPCIKINSNILQLIQNNPEDVISFIFKPKTANEAHPEPRKSPTVHRPAGRSENISLIPKLYTYNNNSKEWSSTANENILTSYNGELRFEPDVGAPYHRYWTHFYWQAKKPGSNDWENVTTQIKKDKVQTSDQRYNFSVVEKYKKNIKFIYEEEQGKDITNIESGDIPWNIRLYSTISEDDDITFQGWEFRLIIENNVGANQDAESGTWNNGLSPYKVNLVPNCDIVNTNKNIGIPFTHIDSYTINDIEVSRKNYSDLIPTNIVNYGIQYYRNKQNASNFNYDTWIAGSESFNWSKIKYFDNGEVTIDDCKWKLSIDRIENNIQYMKLQIHAKEGSQTMSDLVQGNKNEWRIRLVVKDERNIVSKSDTCRLVKVDYNPYLIDANIADIKRTLSFPKSGVSLTEGQKLCYQLEYGIFDPENFPLESITWKYGSDKDNLTPITTYSKVNDEWDWRNANDISSAFSGGFYNEDNKQFYPKLEFDLDTYISQLGTNADSYESCVNLLNGKIIAITITNIDKNETRYDMSFIYDNNTHDYAIQVVGAIEADWVDGDPNTSIILSDTVQEIEYTVKTLYADSFTWVIGGNDGISLTVDKTASEIYYPENSNQQSYRYKITWANDTAGSNSAEKITTLVVRIPIITDSNATRDNGTTIKCNPRNAVETYNKLNEITLQVIYPVHIIEPENFQPGVDHASVKPWWFFNPVTIPIEVSISKITNNQNEFNNSVSGVSTNLYGPFSVDTSLSSQLIDENYLTDIADFTVTTSGWSIGREKDLDQKTITGRQEIKVEFNQQASWETYTVNDNHIFNIGNNSNDGFYYILQTSFNYTVTEPNITYIIYTKINIQYTGPQINNEQCVYKNSQSGQYIYNLPKNANQYDLSAIDICNLIPESVKDYEWLSNASYGGMGQYYSVSFSPVCQSETFHALKNGTIKQQVLDTRGLEPTNTTYFTYDGYNQHLYIYVKNPYNQNGIRTKVLKFNYS